MSVELFPGLHGFGFLFFPLLHFYKPVQSGNGGISEVQMELYQALTVLAILILACACASKLSSWINMPVLVVFLAVGMLAGSEGIGKIPFEDPHIANIIGSIAMAFILFSGGFDTKWSSVKSVVGYGGILSSIGVLLTALFVGLFTWFFLRWQLPGRMIPLSWCLLLGSIVSSTDAAAVFSILRSKSVSLRGKLQPLLEFESGSNDPMAAFLTVFLIPVAIAEAKSGVSVGFSVYWQILPSFLMRMTLGLILGIAWGKLAVWLFNKINFEYDGLYYVLGVATVFLSFGCTELFQGNGFMAIYVTGLVMGNSKFIYHNGLGRFHDGMAWLMQVVLFTMLGLLATPSLVWDARYIGLVVAAFLMLAARPLAVFLCMMGSRFSYNERLLVSWVGLRGGAPVMLATFPWVAGVEQHTLMFHIVFFIVLTSVVLQGMTIMPVAKALHLDLPLRIHPRVPLEFENTGNLDGDTREFEVLPGAPFIGRTLATLGLPAGALVLLIRRGGGFVVPHGNTEIMVNDALMILGSPDVLAKTGKVLGVPSEE